MLDSCYNKNVQGPCLLRIWKTITHFIKWKLPALLMIYLFFRSIEYGLMNLQRLSTRNIPEEVVDYTIGHTLELRIDPPDGTFIEAACYKSNGKGDDVPLYHEVFEHPGKINLEGLGHIEEEKDSLYFCDALHGKVGEKPVLSTTDFPVFGDTTPKKDSVWLIDYRGRRRLKEEAQVTDDHIGGWRKYPFTD